MIKNPLKIGVIGGQGPIASALFTETIYEVCIKDSNGNIPPPQVYLISDPLNRKSGELLSIEQCHSILLDKLKTNLSKIKNFDPNYIIVCCLSAHNVLDKISIEDTSKVQSLVELIVNYVISKNENFVLLSASTERQLQTFEKHHLWNNFSHKISFLNSEEQQLIDDVIKDVKNLKVNKETINIFLSIMKNYPKNRFIIGCSELHVIHKKIIGTKGKFSEIYDPFYAVIEKMNALSMVAANE